MAMQPFQNIQIDFMEFPRIRRFKYLLVIIDHLAHWVEAFPTINTTAQVVSKILLEQIIPRYGMIKVIDSDRGPHFTSKVLQQTMGIIWQLHTPGHPQSSGRVERANQTLKNMLTKLTIETRMDWLKCLPLALLRMRTKPQADLGVSPYEAMFGLPFPIVNQQNSGTYEEGKQSTKQYIQTIAQTLEDSRK